MQAEFQAGDKVEVRFGETDQKWRGMFDFSAYVEERQRVVLRDVRDDRYIVADIGRVRLAQ